MLGVPATGMNESPEEDDPFASPARQPSASKSSLGRKHSALRSVQLVCWITHIASVEVLPRGDPQEVMNLGLAALDSPTRDRFWSFVFNEKSVFSASRIAVAFAAFAYSSGSEISFWKFTCGPSNVRVPIGYDLTLLSDFVTHSSSCWSCCLQLVPILRRPAPRISFLERVGLHLVIICTFVLSLGTHRVERTCCDCGLSIRKL